VIDQLNRQLISSKALFFIGLILGSAIGHSAQAELFQGEFSEPSEQAEMSFSVHEVIPGQAAKVSIGSHGMNGGTILSARSNPSGSPLPKQTIIESGGFHSRLTVLDSSGTQIAQASDFLRSEVGPIPLETRMNLQLIPGTYTLRVEVSNPNTFTDTQGNILDGKWAVTVRQFADFINYVLPEPVAGQTGLEFDARFALAKAVGLGSDLLFDKTPIHGAADWGGFDHFNWLQLITSISDPFSCRGKGVDPSIGGNCADNLSQVQLSAMRVLWPTAYSEAITNFVADIYPWYWDETLISSRSDLYVKNNTTEDSLHFEDNPAGFSWGSTIEFETYLVGVLPNKEGFAFVEGPYKNTALKWRYNQNIIQDAVVDGVQFFQSDDRTFFIPETGGTLEFLGMMTGRDWARFASSLEAAGITVVGITEDFIQPPSTPVIESIEVADGSLIVQVSVDSDGGAALTDITVECTDGISDYSASSASSPVTVTGLTNGVVYTCFATASNGSKTSEASVVSMPYRPNQYMVSAGGYHNCALDDAGVSCWGRNDHNQAVVPALINPVQVGAGGFHSCALDDNGVTCWGNNGYGQSSVPPLTNPVQISVGIFHTCALHDDGVKCWGRNNYYQLDVPALNNPVRISAGGFHGCALDGDRTVCWGRDDLGQDDSPFLMDPAQISAGYYHNCSLYKFGVHCWGNNGNEQTVVPPLSDPFQVSAGLYHSCAIDDSGVQCWGSNSWGQTNVPPLTNPISVGAGNHHSCALDDAGIHCWGSLEYEQATVLPLSFNNLDTDGDGEINGVDTDDDGDGLSDEEEGALGTNPRNADTDGDGLDDKAEVERGSDPLVPDADALMIFRNGFETGGGT
jgi:hypothetical protein